ncbi:MAG TPA: hypothetical protein VG737_16025 [Cyclobacteriaceae bacterium]|nr:hypothetical protein [Cyclobacteriaceae bacterium]
MTKSEIDALVRHGTFPDKASKRELVETHISWVILSRRFVYKIKKPVKYDFLDFSTLSRRRHFCHAEVNLNRRLAGGMYIDVLPVTQSEKGFAIGGIENTIDYAIRMKRMDDGKQMDVLLRDGKVSEQQIKALARTIAAFHQKAEVVRRFDLACLNKEFNDLAGEKEFLAKALGKWSYAAIENAISFSEAYLSDNRTLLTTRLREGLFRDVHGDLHTRNIFLLKRPVLFDCIEFNDEYRRIDVLSEVAFLCMDLDASGYEAFSDSLLMHYNHYFRAMRNESERRLFLYYKCYRANVRAKVNSLRARTLPASKRSGALRETSKYLRLVNGYIGQLSWQQGRVYFSRKD